jgi:anti-sigma factor RsiW
VKPWFQGRLPFSFNLPEPSALPPDTALQGADMTYLQGQPAALLLYTIHQHKVSVFVTQRGNHPATLPGIMQGFSIDQQATPDLRLVAVSDVNPAELHALATILARVQDPH